jgi:hypothetical protein
MTWIYVGLAMIVICLFRISRQLEGLGTIVDIVHRIERRLASEPDDDDETLEP